MGKALMPYHGGKARQAHWIAEELNKCPHRCYIEPFAGAASIFFHKQRAEINVLNDTNFNIVSIFKALRDCPDEFCQYVDLMEYSEALFKESIQRLKDVDLPLYKRAAHTIFLINAACGRVPLATKTENHFD